MAWVPSKSSGIKWGSDLNNSIGNYKTRLGASGFGAPAQNKDSTLSNMGRGLLKVLDVLDRPRNAVAVAGKYNGQGKSALSGAWSGLSGKEHYYGSEILRDVGVKNKYARGIGGFALDMASDPLNAVTFGGGSFAKGVLKGGASMSDDALRASANLRRLEVMRDAQLSLQKDHKVESMKGLAEIFGDSNAAESAVRARAFQGTNEADFMAKAMQEARLRSMRNAGKGVSVFGKTLVSGEKMQNAGGLVNKAITSTPIVGTPLRNAGEAMAKAFDPAFVKGLDSGEREVLRQLRSSYGGKNALKDIQDADKFKNIAALQRGVVLNGKPIDRQILDIISSGGMRGINHPSDWDKIITTTDKQRQAWANIQKSMGATTIKPDATVMDLANVYSQSFKGIGMKEHSEGVLSTLVDQKKSGQIMRDAQGLMNDFSQYVPHTINREFDQQLRKGSMTRNFNVRNDFATMRNKEYENKSITEINDLIREKAKARGEKVDENFKFLEDSALNALMTRQLTSNKVLADKHTVDAVLKTFGRRVRNSNELRKALYDGYDVVVPNASVNLFNIGRLPKEAGSETMALGLENVGKDTARGIKNILESNGNVLQKISLQDGENFLGNLDMTMYALPKGIAEKFNRQAKIQIDDGVASIGKLVDRFYSVWKPLVTGLRPQYHVRNLVSSGFNNFLDLGAEMFNPETQRAAALVASAGAGAGRDAKVTIRGTTYTAKQLHEMMVEHNALNTFFLTDTNSLSKGISEDIARNNTGKMLSRVAGKPAELGRAAGNRVEEYSRAVNFIAHLKQGFNPAEAADISRKIHFDYQELTEFEQSIKKIIPFYTWARKNIPLQIESLLNNPTPYLGVYRAQQEGAMMTDTNIQDLPDYARKSFAIPIGKNEDGTTKVLDPGLPMADLSYGWRDLVGGLNPLAKIPLEMTTNQNFLTQGSLNSYPQETAMKLGEGNALTAKIVQSSPFLQSQLEAHPGASTVFSRVLGSTGVINDINRYALPPQAEAGVLQGSRDANNTAGIGGFAQRMVDPNMVKTFNPQKGAESRDYEYQRQLANMVQYLQDKGYTVPTMTDLNRTRKLYGKPRNRSHFFD